VTTKTTGPVRPNNSTVEKYKMTIQATAYAQQWTAYNVGTHLQWCRI